MAAFEELDHFLSLDFSDDFWSDEGVLHAHALVQNLGEGEWPKLRASWTARSEVWQIRCADVLPEGAPQEVIPVLIQMVRNASRDVCITALDSLREFDLHQLSVDEQRDIDAAIERCLKSADVAESAVLRSFANKLNVGAS